MFRNLFNPDNPLMITLTNLTDCIFLSLFWLLGCVPLVTFGGAGAALYDASFRSFRKGDRHSWTRFLEVFRINWKQGIVPGLVYLAVFCGLCRGLILVWNAAVYGSVSWMVFAAAAVVGVILLGMLNVMLPMLSRFENGVGTLLRNTVLIALANLPRTLGLGLVSAGALALCVRFVFPVFFLPSLTALIASLFIEPMFKPYMPDNSDAA